MKRAWEGSRCGAGMQKKAAGYLETLGIRRARGRVTNRGRIWPY